jgi:hypothetical protein
MIALGRLALGLAFAAGFGSSALAQAPTPFDGQYMGELTLTSIMGGDCTEPPLGALYPLAISNGDVKFSYVPRFNTTLRGKIDKKGVFKASARLKRGVIQMTGCIQGNNITANIVSPSCRYSFHKKG